MAKHGPTRAVGVACHHYLASLLALQTQMYKPCNPTVKASVFTLASTQAWNASGACMHQGTGLQDAVGRVGGRQRLLVGEREVEVVNRDGHAALAHDLEQVHQLLCDGGLAAALRQAQGVNGACRTMRGFLNTCSSPSIMAIVLRREL